MIGVGSNSVRRRDLICFSVYFLLWEDRRSFMRLVSDARHFLDSGLDVSLGFEVMLECLGEREAVSLSCP
jgi:hypothetical protein